MNGNANIMCEKYLLKDTIMCIDKATISQNIVQNFSTTLAIPANIYPSMCIEHCRAIEGQTYALVGQISCGCATKLLFNATRPLNRNIGVNKDMTKCGDTSSFSKMGNSYGKNIDILRQSPAVFPGVSYFFPILVEGPRGGKYTICQKYSKESLKYFFLQKCSIDFSSDLNIKSRGENGLIWVEKH